jgi:hypothetical protein
MRNVLNKTIMKRLCNIYSKAVLIILGLKYWWRSVKQPFLISYIILLSLTDYSVLLVCVRCASRPFLHWKMLCEHVTLCFIWIALHVKSVGIDSVLETNSFSIRAQCFVRMTTKIWSRTCTTFWYLDGIVHLLEWSETAQYNQPVRLYNRRKTLWR